MLRMEKLSSGMQWLLNFNNHFRCKWTDLTNFQLKKKLYLVSRNFDPSATCKILSQMEPLSAVSNIYIHNPYI